jgi:hypothetical protein
MVVHDFDVKCIPAFPAKADAPLVIDAYAPLPLSVLGQLFEHIRRWDAEKVKTCSTMDLSQLSKRYALNRLRELCGESPLENLFRFRAFERLYHCVINTNAVR